MRLSKFFLPILKESPREAEIVSHRLMTRAGMIKQQSAGIYSWLPLGKMALDKVCNIVREEQNRAGAVEILMPTIQSAELWRESGRYDDYGKEMLRIEDRMEREMLFGPTNEEMVTDIFRSYVKSYKDLPLNLYHIQWKFRDERRPRFGVMRGREFLMKDAYSFDLDYEASKAAYNRMFVSYLRTFERCGLKSIPMRADTGPIGGNLSHEFIVLAETGESEVFCHRDFERFEDVTRRFRVEVAGRLVGQKQARGVGDRARNRHTLLLTAGQFCRSVLATMADAHVIEQLCRAFLRLCRRQTGNHLRHHDVLDRREFR